MTGDINMNSNTGIQYTSTHWIRPRDSSGNLHIKADSGGIYLDADVIHLRGVGGVNDTTVTGGHITTAGGYYTNAGLSTNGSNGALTVQSPGGASRGNASSTETGAFKIKLPAGLPVYGMFKLVIHIYEYGQRGNGYEIHCGGHLYPNYMHNRFQVQYGASNSPLTVRYGNDGSTGCIWIGNLDTTWSYPQIWVSEFMIGYSNTSWTTWRSGWSITLDSASFGNSGAMDGPYTCEFGYAATATYATTAGNSGTATALQTGRTLTIGSTGKTFDGTGNVSWTLGEIGAQAAGSYVIANGTSAGDIDADWGQSFKTFDPVPTGTPPLASPNIRTINIGENFGRRTQLAFDYASDVAYFRRRQDTTWGSWREFIHSGNIGSQTVATAGALSSMNISQFTNNSGYITGYTETDTLGTVTNRGNSTSQNIVFSNGRKGLVGVYNAAQTQAIFAMGIDYILTDGGASGTIGNHYGLAWSYNPDYGGAGNNPQSKAGLNHQLLLMQAGVTTAAMGSGIWTSGNISAANFSGSSSGTNTGDQINISGNAATATNATNATNAVGASNLYLTPLGTGSVNVNNGNSAVYRNENGLGATLPYAPVLHLGGGDTMWQAQGSYGASGDGALYFRQGYNGSWGNWLTMLSSANYNSYSPTLTGTGASGTWAISISGSAGSASSATSATSATQVVTIQDDPPAGVNGKLWWESDTGKLKVYYGTSSAWVDATPVPDMSLYYAKAGGPISGDVAIQQTLTVVGNTLIQGTLTETSDISLKENILPLESSLDKVMKLNGVSFNKKATPNVKEIGFIAQEVEAVIPDLVTETNEGIKTVSYSRVTAVLVETIKEQQAQINELKDLVSKLAEKLNSL
jgi:hypothetical protein